MFIKELSSLQLHFYDVREQQNAHTTYLYCHERSVMAKESDPSISKSLIARTKRIRRWIGDLRRRPWRRGEEAAEAIILFGLVKCFEFNMALQLWQCIMHIADDEKDPEVSAGCLTSLHAPPSCSENHARLSANVRREATGQPHGHVLRPKDQGRIGGIGHLFGKSAS